MKTTQTTGKTYTSMTENIYTKLVQIPALEFSMLLTSATLERVI